MNNVSGSKMISHSYMPRQHKWSNTQLQKGGSSFVVPELLEGNSRQESVQVEIMGENTHQDCVSPLLAQSTTDQSKVRVYGAKSNAKKYHPRRLMSRPQT